MASDTAAAWQERDGIKQRVREVAAAFKEAQAAQWAAEDEATAGGNRTYDGAVAGQPLSVVAPVDVAASNAELARLKEEMISLIGQLQKLNPTAAPFDGWADGTGTRLDGRWKLLFTDAADATFRPTEKVGAAKTYQEIDGKKGYFVNCVDFSKEDSKLSGFRVVIKGKKLSDTEVQLKFRRVRLLRRSKWLQTLVIPLPPSWLLRWSARRAARRNGKALSDRGAGFTMLYLDDDMRVHLTFDGQYFVQERESFVSSPAGNFAGANGVTATL